MNGTNAIVALTFTLSCQPCPMDHGNSIYICMVLK